MLNYYQELSLLPQEEIPIHFLWSKVYRQLHLGLVELQDENKRVAIGVSFPEYCMGHKYGAIGGKCRLFASDEAALVSFDTAKWLGRLSDYVHWTGIRPVPGQVKGYAVYMRRQPVTNKERLARRYAKRKGLTYEEALEHYREMPEKTVTLPYIRMKSLSGGREFCLWVQKKPEQPPAEGGTFSTYGLSRDVSVPEF